MRFLTTLISYLSYIVDNILSLETSFKQDILLQYRKFCCSLFHSPSKEVRFLAHFMKDDFQSCLGSNMKYIHDLTGVDPVNSTYSDLKSALNTRKKPPSDDEWILEELEDLIRIQVDWRTGGLVDRAIVTMEDMECLSEIASALCIC